MNFYCYPPKLGTWDKFGKCRELIISEPDHWGSTVCHSGDPDSGESPIALVEILIAISPSGNSDLLITSLKQTEFYKTR